MEILEVNVTREWIGLIILAFLISVFMLALAIGIPKVNKSLKGIFYTFSLVFLLLVPYTIHSEETSYTLKVKVSDIKVVEESGFNFDRRNEDGTYTLTKNFYNSHKPNLKKYMKK